MKNKFKSIISALLVLAMIFASYTVAFPAAAKTNSTVDIISNGGFEDGTNSWVINGDSALSNEAHTGSKSLRMLGLSYYATPARQNDLTLIPNTDYTITFWAKGDSDTDGTKPYCLYVVDSAKNNVASKWFNKTADWTENTLTFNSGELTTCFIKFTCSGTPDGSAIFLDDVSVTYVADDPQPDEGLIKNAGFEDETSDPWLIYADSAIVSDAHTGEKALRICSSGSYAKAARQENIAFEANTDYVLTFWGKGDPNATGTKGYHAYVVGGNDYHNQLANSYVNVTADWTLYTIEFNSGEYTFGYVNFSCGSSPDGSAVILDDFLLEKVGSEPEPEDPALIKNGGFENETIDPWLVYSQTALTDEAYEGSRALRLAVPAGSSSYTKVARQNDIAIEANTDYVFTFWAKAASDNTGTKGYHAYVFGDSDNRLASNSISPTAEWKQYTIEFNSGDFTSCFINFSTGSSPDGAAVVIDDLVMEKAKEPDPEPEDPALIKNGGFEKDTTDPWLMLSATVSADAHTGDKAVRIYGGSYYTSTLRQTDIKVEANTRYTLTFWAKGDPESAGAKGYHAYVFSNDGQTRLASNTVNITADWTLYTVEFNSAEFTTVFVNFTCGSAPDGSAVIVDDFLLEVYTDTALVKNGDFEAASVDPWLLYADSALTSDAHGGDKALRLSGTASYAKVARQTNITLEPNTDYVLSYWAKGDPNSEGVKGYHAYIFSADGQTRIAQNTTPVTADWTLYTLEFNSGDITSVYVHFSAGSAPDGSAIIIDDVVLEPAPEAVFIRNGGFEEGTAFWTLGGESALSSDAHDGDNAMRIKGSSYYASVLRQTGLKLKKNTEYILIYWAKMDQEAGGTKQYHSYVFGGEDKIVSNSIALTDGWRRYMLAFNSGDHSEYSVRFSAGSAPDGSAVFIDDVEVIERDGSGYFGEYPEQLVDGADIRIVSFNVLVAQEDFSWSPWVIGERPEKFKAFIDFYKPDVVGLQECSEKWHDGIKRLLGDTYEFLNPDFGGVADMNCSPIIYDKTKLRVIDSEVYSYTIGNSPRFRLIDIGVFERISDGARFIVSSTHLDPGWEGSDGGDKTYERNVQAGELVQKAREYIKKWKCPYISTGDMNCPAGDVPYNTIVNSGVLVDADAHPAPGVVDHIFHTVGAETVYTARVTDNDLQGTSDHYPLIADIKLVEMPALYTPGDVDDDGEVTVADALAALRAAVGLADQPEGDTFAAADVDGDGFITVSDALRILRIAAGL